MDEGRRLIAESELAAFLGIHSNTPYYWRAAGVIASDVREGPPQSARHFYWSTTVERSLQDAAVGFGDRPVPGFDELWRPGSLVSTKEAQRVLDKSYAAVHRLIHSDRLGAYSWQSTLLVDASDLARCAVELAAIDDSFSTALAARVLCVSPAAVRALARDGRLATVVPFGLGKPVRVTKASVLDFLGDGGQLLPPFVDPSAWMDRRLRANEPMTFVSTIVKAHSVGFHAAKALLMSRQIPHIRSLGGSVRRNILVPQSDALKHFRCSVGFIAQLFDVPNAIALQWVVRRLLCQAHMDEPAEVCPRPECLLAYIAEHGLGRNAEYWYNARVTGNMEVCTAAGLADVLVGWDEAEVVAAASEGRLLAVVLPSFRGLRDVRVLATDAVAFRRRQERLLGGGDYHRRLDDRGTW